MAESKDNTKNDTSSNSSLNIKEIITKLDTVFEEKLSQSFQNIMILPRQKFLNNIISTVKNFINETYGNSIYNNDRFNSIFQSCINNLEDKYNNYTEELEKTWEKYQNSKKIGDEESFFLSNFRKHCIQTSENAMHKCEDGKFGNFIIVIKNIKNNSISRRNKNSNIIHVQYIICNKCKTSFFSNKFLNFCEPCNTNYLCSTMSNLEDPNLLLATWNPPHCETLANEKIHCMKCKDNFLYLNMKTNMLQCLNRSCNYSINANDVETICTICNKNFITNCKIFNPIEVLQIKDEIKITLLIKKKAYPSAVPCCQDLDIKTIDFFHKKDCKGKLYIGELNHKNIIVCEKCKAINNLNKFFWTCPKCENRFKDSEYCNSFNKPKVNEKRGDKLINSFKNFCNIKNDSIKYYNEGKDSNYNSCNNVITSNSVNIKNNDESINQIDKKRSLFYIIKNRKDKKNEINDENKTIENDYIKYKTNTHENIMKGKSVTAKKHKIHNKIVENIDINNKKKYSHSKYLRKPFDIDIIKEEWEPKCLIPNKKFEEKNESTKNVNKQIKTNQNSLKNLNPENNVKTIESKKTFFYIYITHNNISNSSKNTPKVKDNNEGKSEDITENKIKYNYYTRRRSKKYENNILGLNNLEKEKDNEINSKNNFNKSKELSTPSKYLFYKNKKNFLPHGISNTSENTINNIDYKRHNRKNALTISTKGIEINKKNEKEINNNTTSNIKLNCDGNKKKHFFASPENIKKEEEKNERTISHHTRDKYKSKNNQKKEILIDTNTISTKETNILTRKKLREYLKNKELKQSEISNRFNDNKNENKDKNENEDKIENKTENKNEKITENVQNKEIEIDQKYNNLQKYNRFTTKNVKEKQTEETNQRNSYGNIRYNNTNNNNINNYSNYKKYVSSGSVNKNSHKIITSNYVSSLYQSKKVKNVYTNDQKIINLFNSNEITNDQNEKEDTDIKERQELLNEINTQLKTQCFETINNKNLNDNETSIQDPNKLIIKDQKNTKINEKFSKDVRKILSETNIPNFDINDYIIRRQIGEGGTGIIYEAYHKKNLNKYAIKKIIVPDLNSLSEYKNEFEIVYSNPHKNILEIFGIDIQYLDENNWAIYILMELADGDWDSVINKRFNTQFFYSENQLISILKQLTSLLCYLQKEKNIAHRDIKPENILVFKNDIYKITDFGEAKEKILSKQLNSLRGTELYMSPLLYKGLQDEKNDVRHNAYKSDVFSLGYCLIYAASLNFNIIYEIRNVASGFLLKRILYKYLGEKYSKKFIDVLLKMIIFNENKRVDFIELDKILRDEF